MVRQLEPRELFLVEYESRVGVFEVFALPGMEWVAQIS